jgi:hypothetical protein
MARTGCARTMLGMSTPTVIEAPLALEPVTSDPFIAVLDHGSPDRDARWAAFLARVAAAPHRRIYD